MKFICLLKKAMVHEATFTFFDRTIRVPRPQKAQAYNFHPIVMKFISCTKLLLPLSVGTSGDTQGAGGPQIKGSTYPKVRLFWVGGLFRFASNLAYTLDNYLPSFPNRGTPGLPAVVMRT